MYQDELKKLYAQLEVHKTKKMTANNPHLTKKRSSRCALGRSIIRRIAEIPESMSRQCSREEKDGSFRSRSISQSDSFRGAPDAVSISYRNSMKSPTPSMRKSKSDHHSMLKPNSVKRSSQRSETDSLDIPPGVCKSASAQNLTIDTNLLHPDHNRIHKTWSLTSTSTHSMENITKVNRSNTMLTRSRQSISIGDQTRSALQSESYDKAEVCPWEVEQETSVDKNQKHVTYANTEDGEEKRPSSPLALVCPWDHLPPPEKNSLLDKQGEPESTKPKAVVSASAPGSPRPKVSKDQRVFSFRSTTNKWLSVRTILGSLDAGSRSSKDGNLNKEDVASQKSQESASTTPRSGSSSRRPSMEKRSLQKRSLTTADGKPCLVKQNAIRLSSGDSSDRSPRRLVIVKSTVYPWDVDDMQKDGTYENVFLSRHNSKRSSISSWETASSCRTPSTHRRGSNRITPVCNVSKADACPWDGAGTFQEGEAPKRQQSIKVDVCPWEFQGSERSNVCPWEAQEEGIVKRQDSGRSEVCPWESQGVPVISHTNLSKGAQPQQSLKRAAEVCPWETADIPQPSVSQDNEYANVCPWDVQDNNDVVYENLNPLETKGTLTVPHRQEVMRPAVYPGASKELLSSEQQDLAKSLLNWGKNVTKTAESCPWDFPDPPKIMECICPLEEGSTEPTYTDSTSQMTIKVDIWETGNQDEPKDSQTLSPLKEPHRIDSTRVDVCPWDTEPSENPASTKMLSQGLEKPPDVCPWETGEPESGMTVVPKRSESRVSQDTARENVCPWETNEGKGIVKTEVLKSEKLQRQKNSSEDVCPWETEAPKDLKKRDSARADVCPWDTEEPKVLKKQDSDQANICPWETEEPKIFKKQDGTRTDVCPWEKQDCDRADVCPWETEESKVLKKQDSAEADICPTESDDRQMSSKTRADIPNNDKDEVPENQGPLSEADISKVHTDESTNLTLCRRDALCPWEMEESSSASFTYNASDIFTWEPENIPEEDEDADAECAAEALVFPPDL